jgi:hypothetical protein
VNNQPVLLKDSLGLQWTVPQFFHWYYTGGGQTVTLSFVGLLDDYKKTTEVSRKLQVRNALAGQFQLDCNNKRQMKSGTFTVETGVGGGILDPLTILGTSKYNATYVCSAELTCNGSAPKHYDVNCRVVFHFRDRFANPLDWNGQTYERKEELYKACKQDCYTRYVCPWFVLSFQARVDRLGCIVDRSNCLDRCSKLHPMSEWPLASPYDIGETFAQNYTWQVKQNACR